MVQKLVQAVAMRKGTKRCDVHDVFNDVMLIRGCVGIRRRGRLHRDQGLEAQAGQGSSMVGVLGARGQVLPSKLGVQGRRRRSWRGAARCKAVALPHAKAQAEEHAELQTGGGRCQVVR